MRYRHNSMKMRQEGLRGECRIFIPLTLRGSPERPAPDRRKAFVDNHSGEGGQAHEPIALLPMRAPDPPHGGSRPSGFSTIHATLFPFQEPGVLPE